MNRRNMFSWLLGLPFVGLFTSKLSAAGKPKLPYDVCPFHPKETTPFIPKLTRSWKSTALASSIIAPGRIGFADPERPQEYYCVYCLAELAKKSDVTRLSSEPFTVKGVV